MNSLKRYMMALVLLPCFLFGAGYQTSESQPLQPQKMGQITPPHGPLPNHNIDVVINAEFLWWYATVGNLPYAYVKEVVVRSTLPMNEVIFVPDRTKEFDVEWDPGVRVGLGIITNHDGWDLYTDWTYFYNSDSKSISVPPFRQFSNNILVNPPGQLLLNSPWFGGTTASNFNEIDGKWSLLFHQIDLVLGRKFWISPNLVLRPYGGLRGHLSRLHLHIKGTYDGRENPEGGRIFLQKEKSNWKQKFWAAGLLAGMKTTWHMTKHWSVFGDGDVALIYGCFNLRNRFGSLIIRRDNMGGIETLQNFTHTYNNDNFYSIQPVIDLAIGFRWETTFSNCSYRLNFDAGWENHSWIDFNRLTRFKKTEVIFAQDFLPPAGNLSMSGVVVRGRFEF
ncbi:MAG: hypothetical protein K1060chlam2_00594 [Chlamydiae bacterium]|nr:hypothetical protein [Chlamydiota bacterium]